MRKLILAHALEWARQGRAQALSDWIEALPATMREGDPWLTYWFGRAWIFVEPHKGRPAVERAYEAFPRRGRWSRRGARAERDREQLLRRVGDLRAARSLASRAQASASRRPAGQARSASELRARAALLVVLLLRKPDDEASAPCAQRLDELIDGESDLNVRVMAASNPAQLHQLEHGRRFRGSPRRAYRADRAQDRRSPADAAVVGRRSSRTGTSSTGAMRSRTEVMTEARAIAERYGLENHLFDIDHQDGRCAHQQGRSRRREGTPRHHGAALVAAHRMLWPYFLHLRSILEQRLGHAKAAADIAERALAMVRELDIPSLQMPHFLARVAWARAALGDREGANPPLEEAMARARHLSIASCSSRDASSCRSKRT
jgi:hypothetical protein